MAEGRCDFASGEPPSMRAPEVQGPTVAFDGLADDWQQISAPMIKPGMRGSSSARAVNQHYDADLGMADVETGGNGRRKRWKQPDPDLGKGD